MKSAATLKVHSWHFRNALIGPSAVLLVIAALACSAASDEPVAPSLDADVPFGHYIHREYRVQDGLPSNTIHDVVQTHDGYLWVATSNGLARFDGSRFTTFNRSNTPQLPANHVITLCEGRDGTLWIGTEGGLVKHRAGAFERISALDGTRIRTIFETSDNGVWLGTEGPTWRSHDRSHFQLVKDAPADVHDYCEDAHGTLWIATDLGLYKATPSGFQAHSDRPAEAVLLKILANEDGTMWIGTAEGLFHFRDGLFELRLPGFIWDILPTRTGGLYVIGSAALHRMVGNTFEPLTEFESMVCLAEDREGGLWVGKVDGEGLHYYRNQRVRFLPFGERRPYCILEDQHRRMWIGSDKGLHRWADGELTDFGPADGVPNGPVPTLAPGKGGSLWIGTAKGLVRWTGTEFIPLFDVADFAIACLHVSIDGSLWIAAHVDAVIYRLDHNRLHKVACFDASVNCFYEDRQGRLWVGTRTGLFRQSINGFEPVNDVALDRLGSAHFQCFHADDEGSLWIGTRGGLARYRQATSSLETDRFDVFTSREGLATDYIERLHFDNHGSLWMGGRHGFFSVRKDDLEAVAAGRLTRVRSNTLEESEMLTHWAVGSRGGPTTCLASDETLWISVGLTAATLADPAHTGVEQPPVYIEDVRVDGQTLNPDQRVEFSSGRTRLGIEFSAPSFANPQCVQIRYRLDEHDDNWIDAGNERVAYYTDLRPGEYEFRVIADNGYGTWTEETATLGFTVEPRWWETNWFRAAASSGVLLLAVSWGFVYNARIRRNNLRLRREVREREQAEKVLKESQLQLRNLSGRLIRAQEDEKRRLARDLHDDFSQRLAALAIDADALEMRLDTHRPSASEIRDLRGRIVELSTYIHQISRKLHPSIIDDLGLVDALKIECSSLSEREHISIDYEHGDVPSTLTADVALCLYRIAQESLRNAIKHARSDKFKVCLFGTDGQATLTVADEGVGFDVAKAGQTVGLGLRSMEERARLVGGELSIQSRPGQGTEIVARIPLTCHAA